MGQRGRSRVPSFFKNNSQKEPEREEIQTDQTIDLKKALAVIPGTDLKQPQEAAGEIFYDKDRNSVDAAAGSKAYLHLPQADSSDRDQRSKSIDREHQERGMPDKTSVIGQRETAQTGKQNLNRPAEHTAAEEIDKEKLHRKISSRIHEDSMRYFILYYA